VLRGHLPIRYGDANVETEYFFGLYVDPTSISGKLETIILAALLGGLIGLERQWRGNAAGLRTHILVCLGSAVITLSSVEIGLGVRGGMRGDPGHIAAQIVSGVGFLGAGAIIREGLSIKGITTAASIWTTAGIGISLGASPRLAELGVMATALTLGTLIPLGWLENRFKIKQIPTNLEVEVIEANHGPATVLETLMNLGITVQGVQSQAGQASLGKQSIGSTRQMHINVILPLGFDIHKLSLTLTEMHGVVGFHMN
jgi:putative Mg2+ transporter-C (MgtC) family protein